MTSLVQVSRSTPHADPLTTRLNSLLLSHAEAPVHIKQHLMWWAGRDMDKLPAMVKELHLFAHLPDHIEPLLRQDYADGLERDFCELQALRRIDAEYGLLRRYASLQLLRSHRLLEPMECASAIDSIDNALALILNYPWESSVYNFCYRLNVGAAAAESSRPPWIPRPTVEQADVRIRH